MFEHLCKEKSGYVWRTVCIPEPSIGWATDVIDKLSKVDNFLPAINPYLFLLDPENRFFQIDDVGIIAVSPAPQWPALLHVHITFWDGRLRGREGLCRSLAIMVSRLTNKFLFTQIPEDRRAVIAFAERVGFRSQSSIGTIKNFIFTNYSG